MCERAHKPSSVLGDHLSRPHVAMEAPAIAGTRRAPHVSHCILHQVGFTARTSRQAAGELLPRLSILTRRRKRGRFISVALSLESPPPSVRRHPARWCSDFPHASRHAIAWSPHTVCIIKHPGGKVKPFRQTNPCRTNPCPAGLPASRTGCIRMISEKNDDSCVLPSWIHRKKPLNRENTRPMPKQIPHSLIRAKKTSVPSPAESSAIMKKNSRIT